MCLRHYILVITIAVLAGCNTLDIKPVVTDDSTNYIEIEKRADEAYQKEDWNGAEKDYALLAKKVPKNVEPWFRLGNIYARTDRLDAAVAAYREALIRDQKNSKIWHNLGIVQLRQATNTFIEMMQYTDPSDPLNQRAKLMVNAVSNLLSEGFGAAGTD